MCPDLPHSAQFAAESTVGEIDVVIEAIAELSKASLARGEFYHEFLKRVVGGLAAVGGIVWTRDASGSLNATCQFGLSGVKGVDQLDSSLWHQSCAAAVLAAGKATAVAPGTTALPEGLHPNPTDWIVLFVPWKIEGESLGVVEIAQRPGASPSLERGYLRFLEVACEILADYERNTLLGELRRRTMQWAELEEFGRRVHASLDVLPTAYTVANESRRILGCDRVSVLVRRRSKCQTVAVSGTDSFNRRSNALRLMERLVAAVLASGDALWYPGTDELPPQIEEHLSAYLDESHARGLGILPLRVGDAAESSASRNVLGGLVIERFYGPADEPLRTSAAALIAHSALAIRNAMDLERLPLGRPLRTLGVAVEAMRSWRLALAACLVAVSMVAVAALVFVPADFTVEARGELQPLVSRDIFAPDDGVVRELKVVSGARVEANQVLLALRKPALELEFKRVWGELQTARTKLAAIESEQLLSRREDEAQRKRHTELTAQQEELRALVASLESQHATLRQQQSELEVRSPIAGEVLTWNAEQLLAARPVARGQVLLTVADFAGPWGLELRVPDRRMRHLAEARCSAGSPLPVSFVLATDPTRLLRGKLDRVGNRAEVLEDEGSVVLVTASFDCQEVPERIPGASVLARIHCGRRAIGYVWLHDLIDAVRTWVLF